MDTTHATGPRPEIGKFYAFDHVVFYVGNAKQAASYYTSRFGFQYCAYKGLETGDRKVATHVVRKNKIFFAFSSSYGPYEDKDNEIGHHVLKHGDGVRDVAFTVDDAKGIYEKAVKRGAKGVREPEVLKDEHGTVIVSSVQTYGDTVHTFVQREVDGKIYKGTFLPGFKDHYLVDPFTDLLPDTTLELIDHCVGN